MAKRKIDPETTRLAESVMNHGGRGSTYRGDSQLWVGCVDALSKKLSYAELSALETIFSTKPKGGA